MYQVDILSECPGGTYPETYFFCKECDPGKYSLPGDSACSICPRGTYQPEPGKKYIIINTHLNSSSQERVIVFYVQKILSVKLLVQLMEVFALIVLLVKLVLLVLTHVLFACPDFM